MKVCPDLTKQRFHEWTVLERAEPYKEGNRFWLCSCDCGEEAVVKEYDLISGRSKRCKRHTRHGKSESKIYRRWHSMHDRCTRPNNQDYSRYGGRGIKVCERWQDFVNFLKDMGEPPTTAHSLDRIDNNGDYSPENCRWSTSEEQANNRRTSRTFEYRGKAMTMKELVNLFGVPATTIERRIHQYGWTVERAAETTPRKLTRTY